MSGWGWCYQDWVWPCWVGGADAIRTQCDLCESWLSGVGWCYQDSVWPCWVGGADATRSQCDLCESWLSGWEWCYQDQKIGHVLNMNWELYCTSTHYISNFLFCLITALSFWVQNTLSLWGPSQYMYIVGSVCRQWTQATRTKGVNRWVANSLLHHLPTDHQISRVHAKQTVQRTPVVMHTCCNACLLQCIVRWVSMSYRGSGGPPPENLEFKSSEVESDTI